MLSVSDLLCSLQILLCTTIHVCAQLTVVIPLVFDSWSQIKNILNFSNADGWMSDAKGKRFARVYFTSLLHGGG